MKTRNLILNVLLGTMASFASIQSHADDESKVRFSLGTGVPYFLNAEVGSYSSQGGFYLQVGQSTDTGISAGWERVVSDNQKHAFGVAVGAMGIKSSDKELDCDDDSTIIGCVIGSSFSQIFDRKSIYGLGASYSYSLSGAYQDAGWKLRLVAGYGEQRESKENETTASLTLRYQF
ncbi:hypothetical protein PSECIP111951_01273 [Pseudoalteromonas holothuriae]|uniref:Outer membrane protein beta-barrel domain-containing protein n=1 Tax=Pseudoalteromonas holothuriae TaxID=2963714 RepID=A0A9W4VUR3_9GAMM|nr:MULTISPECIES: hypothetical protein [unclassified Pseudoalteromonas]CAH9049513.1 hypothetical protein PSECIP111854_00147 [Pseudoalteromonas sp. CIP111854]CAH9055584.1 hypothetical protein PSECIP111951_01273 [Pseudoalteromonas sp. CIP111951]